MTCKGFCIPPCGLLTLPLQLLLLFWAYASMGAEYVLYYMLSNKIVQQDRMEVQEKCRSDLAKNELNKHWTKYQLVKIKFIPLASML